MGFISLLIVFPLIITVLSVIGVYYLGVAGIVVFSTVISFYYTFGINPVRTYSPNGNMRSIKPSENIKNLSVSLVFSVIALSILYMIFQYFKS